MVYVAYIICYGIYCTVFSTVHMHNTSWMVRLSVKTSVSVSSLWGWGTTTMRRYYIYHCCLAERWWGKGNGKGEVVGCAVHCTDSSSWYNTQRCHLAVARNPMHTQLGTHSHTHTHSVTHTHKSSAAYVNRRRAKLAIRPRSGQRAQKGMGRGGGRRWSSVAAAISSKPQTAQLLPADLAWSALGIANAIVDCQFAVYGEYFAPN